jgi:tight adherence protein B
MLPLVCALLIGSGLYLVWNALTGTNTKPQPLPDEEPENTGKAKKGFLTRLADLFGLEVGQMRKALLLAVPGVIGGAIVGWLIWGWAVMVFLSAVTGAILPIWFYSGRQAKARLVFQEDLASAIDTLRTLLQFGGLGMTGAIGVLAERGPERLRREFRTIHEDASLYGLETALKIAQDRLEDPQFDLVALALITADKAGSRVSGVLDNLVRTIRANLNITRQLQAEQVRQVLSARLVALMPLIILTLLDLSGSDYTAAFDTVLGQLVLLVGIALMVTGYVAMRFLSRLPKEKRFR